MILGSASRRYAKAIFAVGEKHPQIFLDLERFQEAYEESSMMRQALETPLFSMTERSHVLSGICQKLDVSKESAHLLELLLKRERMNQFSHIMMVLHGLRDEEQHILRVHVYTSQPLSKNIEEGLRQSIAERTGKKVICSVEIDPNLLGGLILRVGDMVYDASLATKLETMAQRLLT